MISPRRCSDLWFILGFLVINWLQLKIFKEADFGAPTVRSFRHERHQTACSLIGLALDECIEVVLVIEATTSCSVAPWSLSLDGPHGECFGLTSEVGRRIPPRHTTAREYTDSHYFNVYFCHTSGLSICVLYIRHQIHNPVDLDNNFFIHNIRYG